MQIEAKLASAEKILPLRTRYREEAKCQIVHDSIHRREGWTLSYLLDDIYMEVTETFRKHGLGSYLVQELKRECYVSPL
jgi:hypothetical protein